MAKLTLSDVANLQNENSATATINSNSTAIETALENTLSRDGTAPNQMEANFDMNSYRILNLPKAVNADEPLRLQDLSDFYGTGSVSNIPAGGNQGDVLAKTASTDYLFDWVSDASLLAAGDNIVLSGTSPVTVGVTLTPTFTTVNGITLTASTGTFTLANSKVFTVSNTLTFTGTDGSTAAFGVGGTVAYKGLSLAQFASTTSAELAGVLSDETGTGSAVFSNSPTLVTPALGTPSAVVLTNGTGLPISTGVSGLATGISAFLATPSSANLRAALTDETGTGAAYFVGGDLGTPASGVATNLTGTAAGLTAGNVTTNANLTGDVTSVGNATTIAANAVTNAKLATAADSTIKSNISGSVAAPSDNTITAVLDKQFGSTQGSLAYRGAANWEALSPGTTGDFLKTQGAAANPVWASVPGGGDLLSTNNLSDVADPSAARNNLGIIPVLKNVLVNGAMDIWQRGTSVSCSAGSRTFLADRWFVNPAGAAVTASRTSAVLPTNARSRYNLQITGAASVTTVNVGQRIEAANVLLIKGTVVFQAQIYNGTGAAFTPSLLLGTPAAVDDFTTVTNRLTQVLQSCTNGAYTQVSYSADISGYTNIDNGLQVELQFPSGLLVAAKDVKITEVSLQLGTQPTTFERLPLSLMYNLCLPYYQKSFSYATTPAQNLGVFTGAVVTVTASTTAGSGAESIKFLPPMRTTPTITTYNLNAANANWWDSTASTSRTAATADASEKSFRATVNATTTAAAQHFIHWSADAEL